MKLPEYSFKLLAELGWVAAVSAAFFALTVLVDFDPDAITDLRSWAIGIGAGCVRAAAGAVLAAISKPR